MGQILVALHMVVCSPNLLICRDIAPQRERWANMESCEAIIEHRKLAEERKYHPELVIMGRCRYLVARDGRSIPAF